MIPALRPIGVVPSRDAWPDTITRPVGPLVIYAFADGDPLTAATISTRSPEPERRRTSCASRERSGCLTVDPPRALWSNGPQGERLRRGSWERRRPA